MKTKTNKLLAFGIILSMLFAMAVVPTSADFSADLPTLTARQVLIGAKEF